MQKIWHDRFVEESNLTFNIGMLRKALGDNAAAPLFIETVPKRGYRFIAEVRRGKGEKKFTSSAKSPDTMKQSSGGSHSSGRLAA